MFTDWGLSHTTLEEVSGVGRTAGVLNKIHRRGHQPCSRCVAMTCSRVLQVFIRLARAERAGQAVTSNSIRQLSSRRLNVGGEATGAAASATAGAAGAAGADAVAVPVGEQGDDKAKKVQRAMSDSGLATTAATPPWLKQLQQNAKVAGGGRTPRTSSPPRFCRRVP